MIASRTSEEWQPQQDLGSLPRAVLDAFGLDASTIAGLAGGSINRSWRAAAGGRTVVLKHARTVRDDRQMAFQSTMLARLAAVGMPVAELLPTSDGTQWIADESGYWYARPYVSGRVMLWKSAKQRGAAMRFLMGLHSVAPEPPAGAPDGSDVHDWLAMQDATLATVVDTVGRRIGLAQAAKWKSTITGVLAHFVTIDDVAYSNLPAAIAHGEFQSANLLFDDDDLVSVIDWDCAGVRPRILDLVSAVSSFPRSRHGSAEVDLSVAAAMLRTYDRTIGLQRYELDALVSIAAVFFLPSPRLLDATPSAETLAKVLDWFEPRLATAGPMMSQLLDRKQKNR